MPEYTATLTLVAEDRTGGTIDKVGDKVKDISGKPTTVTIQAEDKASSIIDKIKGGLGTLAKAGAVAGVGLAAGIGAFAAQGITAARQVDNLDASIRGLAGANGISVDSMYEQVNQIQDLNIDAASARSAVVKMTQSQLDLAKATDLVGVAQDASVISGQQTADVLDQLIHGIVTQQSDVLRGAGIQVDANQAQADYAKSIGTTVKALTPQQKSQALMNAVLQEGTKIAGIAKEAQDPIAAMGQAVRNLSLEFGMALLPAIKPAAEQLFTFLRDLAKNEDFKAFAQSTGLVIAALIGGLTRLLPVIFSVAQAFVGTLGRAIGMIAGPIQWIVDMAGALYEAFTGDPGALGVVGDLIEQAFGPEAAAGFRPMLQNLMDFLNGTDELKGPLGTLYNIFQTVKGGLDTFWQALQFVGAVIDAYVTPPLTGLRTAFEQFTGMITGNVVAQSILVGALTLLGGILLLLGVQAAISAAATLAMAVAQGAATLATTLWSTAQMILNAVLTANPIGLVIIVIAALAAGIIYAYNNSETFRNIINTLWDWIKNLASAIGQALQPVLDQVGPTFQRIGGFIETLVGWIKQAVDWVGKLLGPLKEAINLIPGVNIGGGGGGGSGGFESGVVELQQGGWLREPIAGIGLTTGQRYALGEAGPEYVVPAGAVGGGVAGLSISGPVMVNVSGANGPASAWADAADQIFDELYARVSRGLGNRPLGAGRGAY